MLYHLWVNIGLNRLRFALSLSVGYKIECIATIIGVGGLRGEVKEDIFACRYSSFQWTMRSLSVNQSYLLSSRWTSAICSDCCSWWSNASIVVSWTLNTNRTFNLYVSGSEHFQWTMRSWLFSQVVFLLFLVGLGEDRADLLIDIFVVDNNNGKLMLPRFYFRAHPYFY